jgi:hypothetical protein
MKKVGAVHRTARAECVIFVWRRAIEVNRPYLLSLAIGLAIVDLTGCATSSRHQFTEPTSAWRTRAGQLLYAAPNRTLIGDVVVRYSDAGDFELNLSKGPGVTLLSLRQDATFAEVKGAMARGGWSGPIDRAPKQLRAWLELRDKIIAALATARPSRGGQGRHVIRHVSSAETFVLHF